MQERKTGNVVQDPARLSVRNDESWESARLGLV